MAGDKTVRRGERVYLTNRPPRRRQVHEDDQYLSDGEYIWPTVFDHDVLPKARSRRAIRKRAQVIKCGTYGNAVIVHSYSQEEKELLNSMKPHDLVNPEAAVELLL